jgi:hypothetical protein
MFNQKTPTDEIYHSMEKQLVSNQVENKYGFDKLAKATDLLNAAASLFEQAEMYDEAAEVTDVLQELANQLSVGK